MIFVGIMFTAVIPMFLVMNQADTLHEMRKFEVGRLDEEHAIESIFFHLETSIEFNPETEKDEPIITLMFYNRCEIAINIIHVWINGELREVDYLIPPTSDGTLVLRDFVDPETPVPESFSIMAVTDKGNIFLPPSGVPEYSYDIVLGGSWEYDVYTIFIMMTNKRPQLHALITWDNPDPEGDDIIVFDDNLENNQDGYEIGVPFAGTYFIIVTQFYDTILFEGMRTVSPEQSAALVII
jgi:hypothetical protein